MILGGLSGSVARSLPDLGVLRDGPSGRAFEEPSVTTLVSAFDSDRRAAVGGINGRRPRTSPLVTVLPLTAAQRHDAVVDPIHGPRPRRTMARQKRAVESPEQSRRRQQRRKQARDSRWTQPSVLARNSGRPNTGLPSGMMRRRMDITASDPSVEFVERRTSAGWNDGAREYGALADYERGFGQGARATIGLMGGSSDWDSSLPRTSDPIQSPFRPAESYGAATGRMSTRDLHHFYCAVTEKEVQLQVRPSHYADELLAALNPALRGDIHAAANTIQKCWHGYVARRDVKDMHAAALRVKNEMIRRKAEAAKLELRRHMAARVVQARIRGNQTRMGQVLRDLKAKQTAEEMQDLSQYAWAIQRSFRSWMFRFRINIHVRRKRRMRIRRRWRMPIEAIKQAKKASDARGRISETEKEELVEAMEEEEEEVVAAVANMQMMQMRVRVLECADLLNKDAVGGNDVYVTIGVPSVGQSRRTTTRENAGVSASWGDSGDGQELVFNIHGSEMQQAQAGGSSAAALQIDVYDEDIGSSDDLIGSYTLQLPDLSRPENLLWDAEAAWYEINDGSLTDYGKGGGVGASGRVRLAIDWGPPAPVWALRVMVYECKGLLRLSRLDKNDVKIKLTTDGEDYDGQSACTSTIEDGGTECQWAHGRGEKLLFHSKTAPAMLTVEAVDEDDNSADDTIGSATIALLDQIEQGAPQGNEGDDDGPGSEWSLDARWYDLTSVGGSPKKSPRDAGRVRIAIAWEDQTGQDEYDTMDMIKHFDARAEMTIAHKEKASAPSLAEAPAHLLKKRPSASEGEEGGGEGRDHLSGKVTDPMGGAHIRMYSTPRNRTWRDNGDHSYMLTLGFLQSINIAPDPDLRCDIALSKRDRTKEPLQLTAGGLAKSARRCLMVTVLECRKLKKADLFGKNDVFATINLTGAQAEQEQRQTSTVDDGGSAPKWNGGAGESFLFEGQEQPPTAVRVSVWDEDVGSASDLIGDCSVDLTAVATSGEQQQEEGGEEEGKGGGIDTEKDWSQAQWHELHDDKGKAVGEAHMLLRWAAPPPALDAPKLWQLRAKVLECDNLKKMDLMGKNDVYVRLNVAGSTGPQRTITIDGGGADPKWGGGAGEELTFEMSEPPPSVGIEVFDEDRDADDLIGGHVFELGTKLNTTKEWSVERWVELTDAKDKTTGRARLALFWERKQPPRFNLSCGVMECKGLAKADRFGKNDVYVSMTLMASNAAAGQGQQRKTSTIDGGGAAPIWENGDGESLGWDLQTAPDSVLLEVWDEDAGSKDDLLGKISLPLGNRVLSEGGYAQPAKWETLTNAKGDSAGMVKLSINWHPLPSDDPPQQCFTVQPSVLPSTTSKDPNQRIKWGSSQVFKVDDSTYQKVHGAFYLASRPDRKLGTFVAGLRAVRECGEAYNDTWITVRPPPPTIALSVKWQVVPRGADLEQPVGIATLNLMELLNLNSAPETTGRSGLYLRSIIKSAGTRQQPSWGEIELPEITSDLTVIPVDKTVVVRRLGRVAQLRMEVMQRPAASDADAAAGGKAKRKAGGKGDQCLVTFVLDLSAEGYAENESENVSAVVERDETDMLRAEAERHFEDIDEDGSGFLDRHEIKRLAHMLGQELGDHEVNGAMAEMDTSGTGEVSFDDYYAWYSAQKAQQRAASSGDDGGGAGGNGGGAGMGALGGLFARKKTETRGKSRSLVSKAMRTEKDTATARQAFDAVDADGNGSLDANEIRQLAVTLGKKMDDMELALAMREMRGGDASADTVDQESDISFEQFNEWWQKRGQGKSGALRGIRGALGNNLLDGIMHARKNKKQEQAIAEHTMVRQAFDVIDVDGSGTLDSVELRALMSQLYPGKKHSNEEVLAAMREMRQSEGADYDAITFDNFYMWWLAQKDKQGGKIKALKGLFGRSSATIAAAPASAPVEQMTAEAIEQERESARAAFASIDRDGDGTLDVGEIRLLLLDLGRPDSELDGAALALAMSEMRGGGGGKTPVRHHTTPHHHSISHTTPYHTALLM